MTRSSFIINRYSVTGRSSKCASVIGLALLSFAWVARAQPAVVFHNMGTSYRTTPISATQGMENNVARVSAYATDAALQVSVIEVDPVFLTSTRTNLGGATAFGPSAIEWTNHREVFTVGTDGQLRHATSVNDGPFGALTVIPGPGGAAMCSAPSAVSWGPGRVDVLAIACADGALWMMTELNGALNWANRGGTGIRTNPGPQAVSPQGARLDLWVTDANGIIWDDQYNGSGWTWRNTGTAAVGAFGATAIHPSGGSIVSSTAFGIRSSDAQMMSVGDDVFPSAGFGVALSNQFFPTSAKPVPVALDQETIVTYIIDSTGRLFRNELFIPSGSLQGTFEQTSINIWNTGQQFVGTPGAVRSSTGPIFVFGVDPSGELLWTTD
jgi:hypothetical protein